MKLYLIGAICSSLLFSSLTFSQIGRRFPSERKVVKDPVTGTMLTFLTSKPYGDSKIYPTHPQWTSDGEWLIFRSNRVKGEAMAVNERSGDIVQVSEGGFSGMLCIAQKSMKLYFMRNMVAVSTTDGNSPMQIIEVDLAKLFADIREGSLKAASVYQRVCGTTPVDMGAGGDMALDGGEEWVYFRVGKNEAAKFLPPGTKMATSFGPRKMGAGPAGIARMNIKTGELKHVVSVPFQIGHIQSNLWHPGECFLLGNRRKVSTTNMDGYGRWHWA